MEDSPLPSYKIALLGETGTGKSALLDQITLNQFVASPVSHPGLRIERVIWEGKKTAELLFWDFSPAETLSDIPHAMLEGCDGYCLVTHPGESLISLRIKQRQLKRALPEVAHIILENKGDLGSRKVRPLTGIDRVVSAKTGEGIAEAIELLISRMQP